MSGLGHRSPALKKKTLIDPEPAMAFFSEWCIKRAVDLFRYRCIEDGGHFRLSSAEDSIS